MPRQDAGPAVSVERFFQFSLLGLVASGYLAVAGSGYLDTPTVALTTAGLVLRAILICGFFRFEISERASTVVTVGYSVFFVADYFLLSRDFLAATVHLLFFLAVMKILTARTNRDYLYTAVIAFLELLAAAILSINFNFFLFLALYLVFAIAALTSGEIRRSILRSPLTARGGGQRIYPRLSLLTGMMTLGILALTAILFFILPRTAEAAFSRLIAHRIFLPGFANQVTLGDIGEIKTNSRPVMHIKIWSALAVGPLKWRGAALTDFDGKRWTNPNRPPEPLLVDNEHVVLAQPGLRPPGRRITYHVDVDAIDNETLFFAGTPEMLDLRVRTLYRSETGAVRVAHAPPQGLHYDAWSLLEDPPEVAPLIYPPPILPLAARATYLQLPALDPRVGDLARRFAAGAGNDLERARSLERHLRTDFGYTLELPDRETSDPLAYFLFTRRKGHCEYFASAMAVMLRSLDIPARMATGFQSGVYNPVSDLWLVRASDAHSWVEAWIPGRGWTTFDPTPPDPNPAGFALLTRLTLYLDAAETFWQQWVVDYDLTRQGALAYRMEQGAHRMGINGFDALLGLRAAWNRYVVGWLHRFGLRLLALAAVLVGLALGGGPLLRLVRMRRRVARVRRGQASVADATLLYKRMLYILKRRGYQKPVWFTPAEFAASLPPSELGAAVHEFTATYNALRFGGHTEAARRLSTLLDRMERA
ncbi:MAG: transglutaminase domain protein [Candidatus Solibacter sp.]|nr:transglutaminase domain protein [Candidatus Solibacter sp.]